MPRTFDPAPGWSTDGHRIKAPLDYGRGPEKTWVYGALRVRDGKELTRCAASRNWKGYIELLKDIEADNSSGEIFIITDNLSSHNSLETRTWLEAHPRLHHLFIPTGACWLNRAGKAGGASSDGILWPGKVLPIPRRSSWRPVWPPLNSTGAPSPGSGDGLPRLGVIIGVSFLTAFKEFSTSTTTVVMKARETWDESGVGVHVADNGFDEPRSASCGETATRSAATRTSARVKAAQWPTSDALPARLTQQAHLFLGFFFRLP